MHTSHSLQKLTQSFTTADWAEIWQLPISVSKCCTLHINDSLCRPLCINGNILPTVTTCRDLGILISSDLTPSVHIDSIVAKAHQRANAILRCFVSRDAALLTRAFTVYVRPLLEYNCVTWSPQLKQDIEKKKRGFKDDTQRGYVDLQMFPIAKDCIGYSYRAWNCGVYSLICVCVIALFLGL